MALRRVFVWASAGPLGVVMAVCPSATNVFPTTVRSKTRWQVSGTIDSEVTLTHLGVNARMQIACIARVPSVGLA